MSQRIFDASSSKSIKLRTADGGFIIDGTGWRWSQSQALLVISNNVTTVIRKDLIGTRGGKTVSSTLKNPTNVEIRANRFSFNRSTSKATYQDQVRATDPGRLEIFCGKLQIDLSEDTRGFKEVLAEESVELKLLDSKAPVQAKGGRAIYRLGNESQDMLELLDAPTWSAQGYHGRGDRIQVEAAEDKQSFKVIGNGWASLNVDSIRSQKATSTAAIAAHPIEINSDQYEFDGSEVRFEGFVTASQADNWILKCNALTAKINEENKIATSIEASGNVHLTQKEASQTLTSTADHAMYLPKAAGEETIILTGNAEVDTTDFTALGQRIEMENTLNSQTIRVENQAILDLPVSTASSIGILNLPDKPTSTAQSSPPKRIRVSSNAYAFTGNEAVFNGKVSVKFQDGTLNCDSLQVVFSNDRKWIENIFAQGNIHMTGEQGHMTCHEITGFFSDIDHQMERLIAEGNVFMTHPKGKAKGGKAVFYPKTQMVELTGTPRIMTALENKTRRQTQHIIAEGESLLWDQANHRFNGPRGHYRIKTIKNPDLW